MARRYDHSREEIRTMALDAAEKIVVEQGYEGLTARKVMRDIGYAVGTLYLIFENLDDLILHLNARTLDRLYQRMTDTPIQKLSDKDRLIRLSQIYIHFAYTERHRWELVFAHHFPREMMLPKWYLAKNKEIFSIIEASLEPLAPHRSNREISHAARSLWAGVHGICLMGITQKLDSRGEKSISSLAKSLTSHYLFGFVHSEQSQIH